MNITKNGIVTKITMNRHGSKNDFFSNEISKGDIFQHILRIHKNRECYRKLHKG